MADLFLSALVPIVLKKSVGSLMQNISQMWGISEEREKLYNRLLQIKAVLPDAEEKANANDAVKSWLEKLKSAAYDADDLLDEFCYEELHRDAVRRGHKVGNLRSFFSLENPALFRYKMSEKLKKVVGRVDVLVSNMQSFGFVPGPSRQVAGRIKTDSLKVEVVGRDDDKEKIVRLLVEGCKSDDLMVFPIVGMGGLGKTALAKLVYNDSRVKEYFNLPLWVCVSEEFNIGHLVKSIIDLVEEGCNLSIDNMELLQRRLCKVLSGKRYILVLDDVWNENVDAWEQLRNVLNCGDSGSVVIVTTRNDKVALLMGTMKSYNLECLGEEDSWNLFHKRAFSKGVKESKELVEIGRKMVQNCQGLPLAINALGSLMSYQSEEREWLAILKESRLWEQRSTKDVLPVLRLSYDHLLSHMKQCFAFCAIYPKDYEMNKDELIQFWMANGFIPFGGSSSLEIEGNAIFNELVWRSFFQEVRHISLFRGEQGHCSVTLCKMHDLMHDLAQSIMGARCFSTSEIPTHLNQPMNDVHHISGTKYRFDINKVIESFPSIRSIILSEFRPNFSKNTLFVKSNSLRILQLGSYPMEKTIFKPEKMKHLRYLEISNGDSTFTSLPEAITKLYFLQTLRLSDCHFLEKLPEGMRYMSSLRHLYIISCTLLRSMPDGLGQLNCLETLTTYVVGTNAGNSIRELNNLNNLHGQLHLDGLWKIKNVSDAREANLIAKQNLDDLALCWGYPDPEVTTECDPFEVLDALKPCNKLKVLKIENYKGDKLPVWMTDYHMFENLIELWIMYYRECTQIPPVEKLPFLQILTLISLHNLRHLCNSAPTSAERGEDARVAFPSLQKLRLDNIPELCSWCEGEAGGKSSLIFPELTSLEVSRCPKLTAMPIVPLLTKMTVTRNKNLSCFATKLTTLHDLELRGHDGDESLSFQPWESLYKLTLGDYKSILPVGAREGVVSITPTKCRNLYLYGVSNILSNTSLWFWKCFTFVEELEIHKCDSLIYWPEEVFKSLNCLKYISVFRCSNFLGSQRELPAGSSITQVLLPKLQNLTIDTCPNLVEIPKCSTSNIQTLGIIRCPKLQCFPEWLGSMIALKELEIFSCESLNSLPQSIGRLTSLEELSVYFCLKLACLPEGMEGLKALEALRIGNCPNIRDLPEGLLPQLQNLNELEIEDCPDLERHFQKYGKYRHLISKIRDAKIGEEKSGILKDLTRLFPSCKITCFSARS